LKIKGELWKNY